MGQANQRGNFAERQQAAYNAIDAAAELNKLHGERREAYGAQIAVAHWKYSDLGSHVPAYAPLDFDCFTVTRSSFCEEQFAFIGEDT